MFSENGKISEKQLRKLILLPVFASGIFTIPHLAPRYLGRNLVLGLLLFLGMAFVYLLYIFRMGEWFYDRRTEEAEYARHTIWFKLLIAVEIMRFLIKMVLYLLLSVSVLGEAQVPYMQAGGNGKIGNLFVLLPLLLIAWYGAAIPKTKADSQVHMQEKGIEKQGRLNEMLFFVLFIPFLILVLFGIGEVDFSTWIPHREGDVSRLIYGSALLVFFVSPIDWFIYARPARRKEKRKCAWTVPAAVFAGLCLIVLLTLLLTGIYGVNGAGREEMLTIAIMRYIRLPLGVLGRFDMLMIWFFMTGCFVLLCETLFFATYLATQYYPRLKRGWFMLLFLAAAVALVCWMPDYGTVLDCFVRYGLVADLPLSILVPLLGMLVIRLWEREEDAEHAK